MVERRTKKRTSISDLVEFDGKRVKSMTHIPLHPLPSLHASEIQKFISVKLS